MEKYAEKKQLPIFLNDFLPYFMELKYTCWLKRFRPIYLQWKKYKYIPFRPVRSQAQYSQFSNLTYLDNLLPILKRSSIIAAI